jgi:antirestriction protein ArdC
MTTTTIDWRATLIEALEAPGSIGNTYSRFYSYSFLNQIRLMMQLHKAEPCATYRRWNELGRQVRKGSKAKTVLAPIMVSRPAKDSNGNPVIVDGKAKNGQVLVGFRDSNTVFGFSDTDGDELPEIVLTAWNVEQALDALHVERTEFAVMDGNIAGYSFEDKAGRHLAINPAAKYPAKTLLHELAHLVLGHCKESFEGSIHDSRGIREFEAESTAFLCAKELELVSWDPSESRGYIQHWVDRADVWNHNEATGEAEFEDLERRISRVFAAVNKILTAGRVAAQTVTANAA